MIPNERGSIGDGLQESYFWTQLHFRFWLRTLNILTVRVLWKAKWFSHLACPSTIVIHFFYSIKGWPSPWRQLYLFCLLCNGLPSSWFTSFPESVIESSQCCRLDIAQGPSQYCLVASEWTQTGDEERWCQQSHYWTSSTYGLHYWLGLCAMPNLQH